VGAQRYAIDINCETSVLPTEASPAAKPAGVEELQVQTRFLRLYKPADQATFCTTSLSN
jgi:hypothetical protein